MTPDQQIKEIIILLDPEASGTTDAVFLVTRYKEIMAQKLKDKDSQIALLEARLEKTSKEKLESDNAKIETEVDANKVRQKLQTLEGTDKPQTKHPRTTK
jgi:UTP-glucose-1-phosphate uridylyltransferase